MESLGLQVAAAMLRVEPSPEDVVATILLTRFRPTAHELERLPKWVPWLYAPGNIGRYLQLLRMLLVDPLQARTWPCVDAMDYAAALRRGGQMHLFEASGPGIPEVLKCLSTVLPLHAPGETVCMQVRVPSDMDPLKSLDRVADWLEARWALGPDGLLMLSTMESDARGYQVILTVNR